MPDLLPVADLSVLVGEPIEIGKTAAGARRVIPILGGTVTGPRLNGRVLPGGADFQLIRNDGVAELEARYVIECDDNARIYVVNTGLRHGPPEAMERLRRGDPVDPKLIYFRATPRFETSARSCDWLTRHIFLCDGVRRPQSVHLKFFQVM